LTRNTSIRSIVIPLRTTLDQVVQFAELLQVVLDIGRPIPRSATHATIASWSQHTPILVAKLDELLRVESRARSELTQLDDEEPEVIEQHRSEERT